ECPDLPDASGFKPHEDEKDGSQRCFAPADLIAEGDIVIATFQAARPAACRIAHDSRRTVAAHVMLARYHRHAVRHPRRTFLRLDYFLDGCLNSCLGRTLDHPGAGELRLL